MSDRPAKCPACDSPFRSRTYAYTDKGKPLICEHPWHSQPDASPTDNEPKDSFGRPFPPLPCVWRGRYYTVEGEEGDIILASSKRTNQRATEVSK